MRHESRTARVCAAACAIAAALAVGYAGPPAALAAGVYLAKDGDTIESIARVLAADPAAIAAANRLGREVRAGDRLRIPDPPPRTTVPSAAAPLTSPAPPRLARLLCREDTVHHVVEKGDTLTAIARRHDTTVAELLRLNRLRPTSVLAVGARLTVRRTGPRTLVVRRGDTLSGIAARTGVPVDELRRLNELAGDRITAGQLLALEPCDAFDLGAPVPAPPAATAGAPDAAPPPRGGAVEQVVGFARTMLGIPYRFGGTTLRGIDCSAFVQRVFGLVDTPLPRTAREQFEVGAPVPREALSAGDLVFFRTYASFPSHVGIYLGDDLFIHASSVVREVRIDSIERPYFVRRFLGARRVVDPDGPDLASSAP